MNYTTIKLNNVQYDYLAIFLILTQPFIEFVYTNRFIYEIVNVFILAIYAVTALAVTLLINKYPNRILRSAVLTVLIILFLDIRADMFSLPGLETTLIVAGCLIGTWVLYRHASKVLSAVFGVIFAFNVVLPVFPQVQEYPTANRPNGERTGELPVYVHLILDEHIGVEILDESIEKQRDLKQAIKDLYVGNGFRIFGRAYSEYMSSNDSIVATFNNYSGEEPSQFYVKNQSGNVHSITDNPYFREIFRAGYNIQVYQSSWLDLCGSATDIILKCLTYDLDGSSSKALEELDTAEKFDFIFTKVWRKSRIKWSFHFVYAHMEVVSKVLGVELPHWPVINDMGLGPIPVLPVFDKMIEDIGSASAGNMFIAHLLIPHHHYTLDTRCIIRRPLMKWERAWSLDAFSDGSRNTENTRVERYDKYIDQVKCSLVKVHELIEIMKSTGTFDTSTIVVQGDHGSRIFRTMPTIENKDKLIPSDYYDGYSTFFAVKAPHISPGYDLQMLPLRSLLRHAMGDIPAGTKYPDDHFVYLGGQSSTSKNLQVPMPAIPGGTEAARGAID